jgi:hypothetical protein
MGDTTYSVRVAASIAKRGEGATRRRAGLTFGAEPILVSTAEGIEGAAVVTEDQLVAILEDSNLRPGDAPYPEPGLRVKEVGQPALQGVEHPVKDAPEDDEEGEEDHEKPVERRPGRPRRAAKE